MLQKLAIISLILLFAGIAVYEGAPQRLLGSQGVNLKLSSLFDRFTENGNFPNPLLGDFTGRQSILTNEGVLSETNRHRDLQSLLPLSRDPKLDKAAQAKLEDMFAQQYFEHNSPDGKHPSDVITAAGYEFLTVGENLALGNFENDQVLVQAWMDSPGHRANILNSKFHEIGIAVGKGVYQGHEVWMAVQEFGTPLDTCPSPDESLAKKIEDLEGRIATQEAQLKTQEKQLHPDNYSNYQAYQQAVQDYNQAVGQLNSLIAELKQTVENYNSSVNQFNNCLESNA
ncbi:MAG: CAP domain-containing protein [Candidatus Doudnabacteria bacterium]